MCTKFMFFWLIREYSKIIIIYVVPINLMGFGPQPTEHTVYGFYSYPKMTFSCRELWSVQATKDAFI